MGTPMTALRVQPRFASRPRRQAQRGVIMILTLVALVLLLIGVAAMVRSTDTATAVIGNLAFRRDLTNRAEVAIATAKATLNSGGALYSSASRDSDSAANNYSATRLPNATGIGVPSVLVSNSQYTNASYACLPASCVAGTDGVLLRWIIDRQCSGTNGTPLTFTTDACGFLRTTKDTRGSAQLNPLKPTGAARGLFRISVRVTGPRNTEAYIQTIAG
jgi:type IV pilus assembly protein PilX